MAGISGISGRPTPDERNRYQLIVQSLPEFEKREYAERITVALDGMVERSIILVELNSGISDIWIPMSKNAYPRALDPSHYPKFEATQSQLLGNDLIVATRDQWPGDHLNLSSDAMSHGSHIPRSLRYVKSIGGSSGGHGGGPGDTDVVEVKLRSNQTGASYALKRISRMKNYNEELEQMNYIKGELSIMKKMRNVQIGHFVKLVASYTDIQYVGMLLVPAAECNLATFLDRFPERRDEHLLSRFFGCLTTALAYLHYVEKIRHKDIKPENILVKENNVLLADFGISLDWSMSGCTTTTKEKRRTWQYCSPEVALERQRNSKSDIWSLGCVFLEMAAVLKGKTRHELYDILDPNGQRPPRYWHSEENIASTIEELRTDSSQHENQPLDWIQKMLQSTKEKRPNAIMLRDEILSTEGGRYCGICCRRQDLFNDISDRVASGQSYSGLSPPAQAPEPLIAKVLLPRTVMFHDVRVTEASSLSKNWISPLIANEMNFELHHNSVTESIRWKGRELKSTKYTEVTWLIEGSHHTRKDVFLVATEPTEFDVLVTRRSYNTDDQQL